MIKKYIADVTKRVASDAFSGMCVQEAYFALFGELAVAELSHT
jgi:hypothetical protein